MLDDISLVLLHFPFLRRFFLNESSNFFLITVLKKFKYNCYNIIDNVDWKNPLKLLVLQFGILVDTED